MNAVFKDSPTTEKHYNNSHHLDDKRWGWEGWKLAMDFEKKLKKANEALEEIANSGGFDNIGNWARSKAREAIGFNIRQKRGGA